MENMTLKIDGMSCEGCVRGVERALSACAGVRSVRVDLAAARAEVAFDPQQTGAADLLAAVEAAGFDASVQAA